ncbi:MAG: hypothetical protein SGARI_003676 [Bacillariaceae sp.]
MNPPNSVNLLSRGANTATTSDVSSTTSSANSHGAVPKQSLSDGDEPKKMPPVSTVVQSKQEREAALRRGSVVIPCKARGMPMDHSGHTAFFEITKDMAHGQDLICSHEICRNGGVKFLYCMYCACPVARRSFRAQHSHPEIVEQSRSSANKKASEKASKKKRSSRKDGKGPPRKRARSAAAAAAAQPNAQVPQLPSLLVDLAVARLNAENSASSNDGDDDEAGTVNPQQGRSPTAVTSGCSDTCASSETQSDRGGGSDSDAVVGENNAAGEDNEELRIRNEWIDLLAQRRRLQSTSEMTAWLVRVLATSDPTRRPPEAISDETEVSSDLTASAGDDAKPAAKKQKEVSQPPKREDEKGSDASESTKTDNDMMDLAAVDSTAEDSSPKDAPAAAVQEPASKEQSAKLVSDVAQLS